MSRPSCHDCDDLSRWQAVRSAGIRIVHIRGCLLAVWALAFVVWQLVPVVRFDSSWQGRGIGVVLAVAFVALLALAMRSKFRRVAARPPGHRRIDRWLAPLPAWFSAPLVACLYMVVPAVIVFGMAMHFHRLPFMSLWGLCEWFIVACGVSGFWSLAWREQRGTYVVPEHQRPTSA
jgi:hypothetical protein